MMRVCAVTCVKNEGPFLIEWIAFNRGIGVTDFLFYSNDCTDGTDDLLEAMAARGIVTHLPNPARGRNYQMEALKDAARQEVVRRADWLWVADVDEFLNIRPGEGTIADLVAACGDPHAISVSFQFFANGGIEAFKDEPVIAQFTHSHNPDIWTSETAIEVKTLIKKGFPFRYLGAHRPFLKKNIAQIEHLRWTDGSGRQVPESFRDASRKNRLRKFPAAGAREHATLNHYALRSLDSYLVKNDRGDVNREHRTFDTTYWRERNDPAYRDLSIQRYLPRLKAEIARLMQDDEIARLHRDCVRRHQARRDELLAGPVYREMRAQLRTAPTISPQEEALLAFIAGEDRP